MKQNTVVTAIICIALFFCYHNSKAQTKALELSKVKKEIENTNKLYFNLFAKKDPAIIKLYTDDACLLAPNMLPVSGKKAIKKDFDDTFAAGKVKGVKFRTGNIYGDSKDYVTEEGTWQVFDLNGNLLDNGKYLKLWKRTNTSWRIFRDLFNSNRKPQ